MGGIWRRDRNGRNGGKCSGRRNPSNRTGSRPGTPPQDAPMSEAQRVLIGHLIDPETTTGDLRRYRLDPRTLTVCRRRGWLTGNEVTEDGRNAYHATTPETETT